jgi:hypothetical protein
MLYLSTRVSTTIQCESFKLTSIAITSGSHAPEVTRRNVHRSTLVVTRLLGYKLSVLELAKNKGVHIEYDMHTWRNGLLRGIYQDSTSSPQYSDPCQDGDTGLMFIKLRDFCLNVNYYSMSLGRKPRSLSRAISASVDHELNVTLMDNREAPTTLCKNGLVNRW